MPRTVTFHNPPGVLTYAAVVGKKEGEGPLGDQFDQVIPDTMEGHDTWEQAESALQKKALHLCLQKAGLASGDIDIIFAGDLLNQCIGSAFGLREFGIPFMGLFGACSTMALSLLNSAVFVSEGAATIAAAVTSSHFCSAERQFRFPLDYGSQRTPTAQWTVTGAGAVLLSRSGDTKIVAVTPGKITDLGVKDANNMGAAMAPAACDTILTHLQQTGTKPQDYDRIFTGDLGWMGSDLLLQLARRGGVDLTGVHDDCGKLIFDREVQDVHGGGSGCGCSASVLCAHILPALAAGKLRRVLFCATGALMSTTSSQQGDSIPGICHAIEFRR